MSLVVYLLFHLAGRSRFVNGRITPGESDQSFTEIMRDLLGLALLEGNVRTLSLLPLVLLPCGWISVSLFFAISVVSHGLSNVYLTPLLGAPLGISAVLRAA